MRVTCAVREYVRKAVLAKVADKLKAAEAAKEAAEAARDAKVKKAEELCKWICAEAQAKFVKEAKRKLGLTYIPDSYSDWNKEVTKGGNPAIYENIGCDDFVETLTSRDDMKARRNPCKARKEFDRIMAEPGRIRDAANAAADKLLFELELGKVAKSQLDEALRGLEVAV